MKVWNLLLKAVKKIWVMTGCLRKTWDKMSDCVKKTWDEMDGFKKKACLAAGLLLVPVGLLLHPVSAVNKLVKPGKKEQQVVAGAGEQVQSGRERGSAVSRGGVVDRNSVYLMAQVIEGEAADEPYEGKVAVGAVILNRTESPDFPHTIPGVIYETDAFESVSNGQYLRPVSKESLDAAIDALNGRDPTGGALYFWNPEKATSPWVWSRPIITRIGGHVFAL
ncbi:MAG: hypothetical protein HPY89_11050 [Pelotomaculum sp.]|uniref:Cell wall hydrolyses n=1 Tax=Pelotomaculum thermopropionicum (strain DSM 13744 / JCM 10971 / SI) TaxID=370438 RepID=A5D0Q7_PELTS|nr:hypothetical protein [Pelotomaculum sp.]BAF60163.1 cell wall hydrolyses [Pelotomaculum thermopropionicum SI]